MNKKHISICVLLFTLLYNEIHAQSDSLNPKRPLSFGFSVSRGVILNHKKGKLLSDGTINNNIVLSNYTAFQAQLEWQTTGTKQWHKFFNYPSYGIALTYFNVDDTRFGHHGLSLMATHNLKCITSDFYKLKFRVGVGVGYFSTIYDKVTNPVNQYVSTHISAAVEVAFENYFQLKRGTHLVITPTITHFSNGASVLPNFGLNMFGISVGFKHQFSDFKTKVEPKKVDIFGNTKNFVHFAVSYGSNTLAIPNYNYFFNYTIDASYGRKVGKISKLIIGANIIHNSIDNNPTAADLFPKGRPFFEIDRSSIWAAHEFLFNRLGLITGFGIYTHKPKNQESKFYTRVGLRYHFHKNIFGAVILRSHSNVADTIEWTIGATI